MGLSLLKVAPLQGQRWIVQGLNLWRRRPLGFLGLFTGFLLMVFLVMLVPWVGSLLGLMMVPMLSLGALEASRSVLQGGPVHAGQIFIGLRHPERARRNTQRLLYLLYALASLLVLWLSDLVDGGRMEALMRAGEAGDGGASGPAADVLADGALLAGVAVRLGLAGLLAIPFWHAPALAYWHGQGALQALFSSTLAVWRARGAFIVYTLGWGALVMLVSPVAVLLVRALGSPQAASVLAVPLAMVLSSMFYASLWFVWADSFGPTEAADAAPAETHDTPPAT